MSYEGRAEATFPVPKSIDFFMHISTEQMGTRVPYCGYCSHEIEIRHREKEKEMELPANWICSIVDDFVIHFEMVRRKDVVLSKKQLSAIG
ncbi:hypothetical protein TNCV_3562581 [Trichonephila clavipes]|nr:hypothetical protein TNCV_3562581 [Trichonephila clavipes]